MSSGLVWCLRVQFAAVTLASSSSCVFSVTRPIGGWSCLRRWSRSLTSFEHSFVSWPAIPISSLLGRCQRKNNFALALNEKPTRACTAQWTTDGRHSFLLFGIARCRPPRQLRDCALRLRGPFIFVSFRAPSASASESRVRVISPPPALLAQPTAVVLSGFPASAVYVAVVFSA